MQILPLEVMKAQDDLRHEKEAEKEKTRVLRHVSKPAVYIPFSLLTPEKRAYMKRFGSRPKKRKHE